LEDLLLILVGTEGRLKSSDSSSLWIEGKLWEKLEMASEGGEVGGEDGGDGGPKEEAGTKVWDVGGPKDDVGARV
jgi:hypothetical protein